MKKGTSKKHLTKRAYVYLALVTMATISLLAKPIKRGYTALEKHLANASCEEKKANLRRDLKLLSDRRYNEKVNGYVPSEKKDFVDEMERNGALLCMMRKFRKRNQIITSPIKKL